MYDKIKVNVDYVFNERPHRLELLAQEVVPDVQIALVPQRIIPHKIQPYMSICWKPLKVTDFHTQDQNTQIITFDYILGPAAVQSTRYVARGLSASDKTESNPPLENRGQVITHFCAKFYKQHCEAATFIAKVSKIPDISANVNPLVARIRAAQRYAGNFEHARNVAINAATPIIQFSALTHTLIHHKSSYLQEVGKNLAKLNYGSQDNKDRLFNKITPQKTRETLLHFNDPALMDYFVLRDEMTKALDEKIE